MKTPPFHHNSEWLLFDGINVRGPISSEQLLAIPNAQRRRLLVTTKGYRDWYPLSLVRDFQHDKDRPPQRMARKSEKAPEENQWHVGAIWSGMFQAPQKWNPWRSPDWSDRVDPQSMRSKALEQLSCYAGRSIWSIEEFLDTFHLKDTRTRYLCLLSRLPLIGVTFLSQLMNELAIRLPEPSLTDAKIRKNLAQNVIRGNTTHNFS